MNCAIVGVGKDLGSGLPIHCVIFPHAILGLDRNCPEEVLLRTLIQVHRMLRVLPPSPEYCMTFNVL